MNTGNRVIPSPTGIKPRDLWLRLRRGEIGHSLADCMRYEEECEKEGIDLKVARNRTQQLVDEAWKEHDYVSMLEEHSNLNCYKCGQAIAKKSVFPELVRSGREPYDFFNRPGGVICDRCLGFDVTMRIFDLHHELNRPSWIKRCSRVACRAAFKIETYLVLLAWSLAAVVGKGAAEAINLVRRFPLLEGVAFANAVVDALLWCVLVMYAVTAAAFLFELANYYMESRTTEKEQSAR